MRKLFTFFFLLLFALTIVGCGGSDSSTPVVEPIVVAATDDAYQTLSDTALTIDAPGVLSNDTGVGLTVSAYDAASVEGGTVAMATDGGFTYTPPAIYTGTDSFTYTATDGATQDTGTVLVTIEPIPTFSELQKRLASDGEATDYFGQSVSISGDYAIVGADGEASGGGYAAGAAYLFNRDEGGDDNWGQVVKLIASDAGAGDRFGISVSISGDYAIVGAYEFTSATAVGAAYIFHRNQGGTDNWGEVAILTASDAGLGDQFGKSVSISGDYAIVGAYGEDYGDNGTGTAYIFHRNQGGADNWGEVTKLTAFNTTAGWFGISVSISGDYAIVGTGYGAAYIFHRDQGGVDSWGGVTPLTASNDEAGDYFGRSVAISGGHAIVGAYREDSGGSNAGAAYTFFRDQGGIDSWGEVAILLASDPGDNDYFGKYVSISGDYAIVGAYQEDTGGINNAGAAYLFHRNEGGADSWGEVDKLTASDALANDWFGSSVSISGGHAIVGAYMKDSGGSSRVGAVYIFESDLAP